MAQFTINLPGGMRGEVRQGKVFKKRAAFTKQWPWIRLAADERRGYIVTVDNNGIQYHLLKTGDGKWPAATGPDMELAIKAEGKWQPVKDDNITLAIKKAIDDYENKQ